MEEGTGPQICFTKESPFTHPPLRHHTLIDYLAYVFRRRLSIVNTSPVLYGLQDGWMSTFLAIGAILTNRHVLGD